MQQKLLRRGESSAVAAVIARLEESGLLNDHDFAVERARFCRKNRNWGLNRIRVDLKRQGVEEKLINLAVTQLAREDPEEESLSRAIDRRLRRHGCPRTSRELRRLFQALLRMGYAPSAVRSRLQSHFSKIDWNR